jgi:serine/threonine-protein kinase
MGLQTSLTHAFEQWVLYVALEPFVRRYYPHVLVSWKRVLAGKFLNAQVGRDVLVGVVAALTLTLLLAIAQLCQVTGTSPLVWPFSTLDIHEAFASCSFNAYISMCVAVGLFVLAVLAARIFRHPFAGYIVLAAFLGLALQTTIAQQHRSSLAVVIPLLVVCMLVAVVCFRLGLLTMIVMILTSMTDRVFPITANVDAFYFRTGMVGVVAIAGLAIYGCIVSQRTDTVTRWA